MKSPISKASFKLDTTDRYRVIIVRKVSGVLHEIKRRKIKIHTKEIPYRSARFPFDIAKPIYRRKNTFYYMVDIKLGQLIVSTKGIIGGNKVPPEMIEAILYESVVAQTVSGLEHLKWKPVIIYVILSSCIAVLCGYLLGVNFPMGG